MKQKRKDYTN